MTAITVLVADLLLTAALVYGVVNFFMKKSPVYFKFLTCAVGCYALSEYLWTAYYFCYGQIPENVGIFSLGYFGCYLFMLSMNYGPINSVIDDGNKKYRKYRALALIAPILLALGIGVFCAVYRYLSAVKIIMIIILNSPKVFASYFNLKYILLPDEECEFVKGLKLCNALSLVIYFADLAGMFFISENIKIGIEANAVIVPVCLLAAAISAKRGQKKWSI